ncbi:MAG: glycosyltransferase family 2 protein [Acidobacteriia bacterium]|nr:glycosyltransferase family 2 protein [Terriglobia bacterium]
MDILRYLFWIFLAVIAYVYIGYPLLVFLLSKIFSKEVRKAPFEPTVSILISAYNEAEHIGITLENKLALDYPGDKMEILVISDGSTDGTDDVVGQYSERGVRFFREEPRRGKTAALNFAVPQATGEILVFSDANSIYERGAVRNLVKNFSDPKVGYVTGKMIYANPDGTVSGEGCSTYMKYENFIRRCETRVGSIVGVDGGIDAVRRSLYQPMRPDLLPDFVLPLRVVEQGFRVVYEPEAILREEALASSADEYRMRVRVSLRAFWALHEMKQLLNVFAHGFYSIQLGSHKILRYLAFVFVGIVYMLNLGLLVDGPLYQALFALQTLFYICSALGYYTQRRGKGPRLLGVPFYFILVNVASAHAFLKFLKGTRQAVWSPRTG